MLISFEKTRLFDFAIQFSVLPLRLALFDRQAILCRFSRTLPLSRSNVQGVENSQFSYVYTI